MPPTVPLQLVLYSKPGCHLCEGLQEKLEAIQNTEPCPLDFTLDIRDITTRDDWFAAYQYEIPVLYWAIPNDVPQEPSQSSSKDSDSAMNLVPISRPSPRASVANVLKILQAAC